MICATVQKSISAFLDRTLIEEERIHLLRHLEACRDCAGYYEQMERVQGLVAALPCAVMPANLCARLRVLASNEWQRRLRSRTTAALLRHWGDRLRLVGNNLMRPLALPFAGGLLSALFLMSVLVGTLGFRMDPNNDVPTALYTQPSLDEMAPFGFNQDEAVVELTINERGQITECSIPHGNLYRTDLAIANMMLFSRFTPATLLGVPMSGKVRVSLRRKSIVVRG